MPIGLRTDGEEIRSGDEGDDESQTQNTRVLSQTLGKHRILRTVCFPEEECDQKNGSKNERGEHVGASPAVLITAPLHAGHEQNHASNAQDAADIVDLSKNLLSTHANAVDSRWREVKDGGHDQTDQVPDTAQQTNPAPRAVVCNKLAPENGRAKRDDREDEDGNVFSTLRGRRQLGRYRESSQLVDTGSNACKHHAADEDVHLLCGRANDHAKTDE